MVSLVSGRLFAEPGRVKEKTIEISGKTIEISGSTIELRIGQVTPAMHLSIRLLPLPSSCPV